MGTAVREPHLVEQLVEVPTLVSPSLPFDVKEEDTIVAVVSDASGRTWSRSLGRVVAGGGCRVRATPNDHPEGYTARPGRKRNTGPG